jgi:hypothetical protein
LCDLVLGRWLSDYPREGFAAAFLAFSPDGRLLAASGLAPGLEVREVITGKRVFERDCENRPYYDGIAFGPDGKTLAWSGGEEDTILIGDLAELLHGGRPVPPATARELPALWEDLGGADAAAAYRAVYCLAAAPGLAVPLLRERLRPVAAPGRDRIAAWIADLDSSDFKNRERATAELERLEEAALPALQQALKGNPSAEVKRRLEQLVSRLAQPLPAGAELRALRGVVVLEHIGSPEARRVLEALAAGDPGARLTQEAKASLRRLATRSAPDR